MRGDFLEEVTHLKGWTYRISGNASAYPPEHHFFGDTHCLLKAPSLNLPSGIAQMRRGLSRLW